MRAVSDAFLRTLQGSHKIRSRARICTSFQTGTNPDGTFVEVMDGTVTLDGKADVRGTLDIVIKGEWPENADDLITPYGHEIYVERGIEYSDDLIEYVGLGYYRIQTPEDGHTFALTKPIRVAAEDRMRAIIEGRLLAPVQFVSGTTFGLVVQTLIEEIYPSATIEWDDSTDTSTLVRSLIVEEDRYGFLNDAIASRGKIWYWDHRGVLVIKDVPSTTDPVYEINHAASGTLIYAGQRLTRDDTFNAVVALGEGADTLTPVRGVAIDDDTSSPTYFFGPFGQVPRFYSSSFLSTDVECTTAAQSLLARELGLQYVVSFRSIVNPALEPYDVVQIKFAHHAAAQTHVLDVIPIPLHPGGVFDVETREQRVTL